jgi:hypothetical protein
MHGNCALLGYYAASSGNVLDIFGGTLDPENGTDGFSRNDSVK